MAHKSTISPLLNRSVNYTYFALIFLVIALVYTYYVFLVPSVSFTSRLFYLFYAVGQSFIEIGLLALASQYVIQRWGSWGNLLLIALSFLLLILHCIDFPLTRLMGISVWLGVDLMKDETIDNFIELLYATNISLKSWIIIGSALLSIPLLGFLLFTLCNYFSSKKPWNICYKKSLYLMTAFSLMMCGIDFRMHQHELLSDQALFLEALPWKQTFFSHSYPQLPLQFPLKPLPSPTEMQRFLETKKTSSKKKPNLFFFVIESLREDFITEENSPSLHRFKQENISFPVSFSASNATQSSWFSIFHSRHSLYWDQLQPKNWQLGSMPLQILKKMGYKIHVYSSARLNYYQMDQVLFGPQFKLVDAIHRLHPSEKEQPHHADKKCFSKLLEDMDQWEEEGHLAIVFLDSTHFDYSWPATDATKFTPIIPELDYLKLACLKENLDSLKNRYRNAIFFIDSLFGKFLDKLEHSSYGKQATIVVTADHAEEFFEQGHVFHASHLSSMQTSIPLYYKFGDALPIPSLKTTLTSHVDIFPSLLHYLGEEEDPSLWSDGKSIFKENPNRFALTTRFNGMRTPYEFFLHNGKNKLISRFLHPKKVHLSRCLQLISSRNSQDHPLKMNTESVKQEFGAAFESLFSEK